MEDLLLHSSFPNEPGATMDCTSNSSASNSGASEGRIAANVAQALAQVAQQAQARPVANLSERERAIEQAALPLMALLPSAGGGLNLPGGLPASASEPLLIVSPDDYNNMPLPKDVWQRIFALLDETALGRIRQSCRRFYHAGKDLHLNYLNPQSELGRKQRDLCKKVLKSILDECPRPSRTTPNPDYQPTIQRFKQALQAFASRYRCVEVRVLPGFELAVVDALKEARCWQNLHLQFPGLLGGSADVMKLVSELGQALSAQQRTVPLDLKIELASSSWPTLLSEKAFAFTGLHVGDVNYDKLATAKPLEDLLSGQNALDCFEMTGDPRPDAILPWLKNGSHDLTSLLLHDMPEDGQLLIDVLGTKPKLSALALDNGSFKGGDLTLAQVLQAAPGLKTLSFTGTYFHPGGSANCAQVLRDSQLCEIVMSSCRLIPSGGQENLHTRLCQTHSELLQGLSEAHHLEVFKVTAFDDNNSPHIANLLAQAFLLNPAAKALCILDAAEFNFAQIVAQANTQRALKRLNPVELRMESTPDFEDDSDLMASLVNQFSPAESRTAEGDGMEIDEAGDDEMTDDDMYDDSDN